MPNLNQIIHANCIDALPTLPPKSVDLIFADPPYNLQLKGQQLWRPNTTLTTPLNAAWDQFPSLAAYDSFSRHWLQPCRRLLKDTGTLWVIGSYHNIYRLGSILMDLDYWILNDIVWIKTNPMPNFQGVRFTNAHETLLWVQKIKGAKYTFNYHPLKALNDDLQMRSDWQLPLCNGQERLKNEAGSKAHPTQKPESLLYRIIQASTNPGDIILDPFFGTGTTGAVAKKLHRHYIGIEQQAAYIEIAQQRLAAIQPDKFQPQLYTFPNKRTRPRIPFGRLLEQGLLKPGQKLYFGPKTATSATILSNGHLKHNGTTGSIHQIAKSIKKGPCNGWQHWYYLDPHTNHRLLIDHLREQLRQPNPQPPET